MDRARILVVGAGALGSFYGGFLRRAGHEVTLLGRTEHLAAIRSRGLSIEGVFGEASVRGFSLATSTDAIAGPFDLVILAVKSYDVDGATRSLAGVLAERPESRRIMDEIIEEGFAVARAERVDLLWKYPGEYRRHFYETLLPPTATHRSSMLQDIERGRRTEIDAINGYVCRRGRALGIEVPQNLVLTGLVHAADAAQRGLLPAPPAVP
jgi:ketopantoate reductase